MEEVPNLRSHDIDGAHHTYLMQQVARLRAAIKQLPRVVSRCSCCTGCMPQGGDRRSGAKYSKNANENQSYCCYNARA